MYLNVNNCWIAAINKQLINVKQSLETSRNIFLNEKLKKKAEKIIFEKSNKTKLLFALQI